MHSDKQAHVTFGERLSLAFAVACAWTVPGIFIYLIYGFGGMQSIGSVGVAAVFSLFSLPAGASVIYSFCNPRRPGGQR